MADRQEARLRRIESGEEERFVRSAYIPFLEPPNGDAEMEIEVAFETGTVETDRTWVVDAGDRFVGNCCNYTMDLTLPSAPGQTCPVLPMAGVSMVGVHPTHRRRGFLTQMMMALLADARARSEPVAGLIAAESVIYGRFGFGHATDCEELVIDSRASAFRDPAPEIDLELVELSEAVKRLPPIFERQRVTRPGEPSRSKHAWWEHGLRDSAGQRRGGRGSFVAACDDGYVFYRAHDGDLSASLLVEELRGVTPEVEGALWRFVLDLDLVGEVKVKRRPVDEPVRWRLADPRQLRVLSTTDMLWLRVLDVPATLEARGYRTAGRIVLDLLPPRVGDGEADPAVGRWVLEAGPDGSECRPARGGAEADLRMEITELGSLVLGGFKASVLAGAGRVEELTAGSLDVADNLLASPLAPVSTTGF